MHIALTRGGLVVGLVHPAFQHRTPAPGKTSGEYLFESAGGEVFQNPAYPPLRSR